MLVNVLAKIRKIKRTAKAIRKNYSKKSKIAVVLRRRGASSDRPTIKSHFPNSFHFKSHLYTQCTERTHHRRKGDAFSAL